MAAGGSADRLSHNPCPATGACRRNPSPALPRRAGAVSYGGQRYRACGAEHALESATSRSAQLCDTELHHEIPQRQTVILRNGHQNKVLTFMSTGNLCFSPQHPVDSLRIPTPGGFDLDLDLSTPCCFRVDREDIGTLKPIPCERRCPTPARQFSCHMVFTDGLDLLGIAPPKQKLSLKTRSINRKTRSLQCRPSNLRSFCFERAIASLDSSALPSTINCEGSVHLLIPKRVFFFLRGAPRKQASKHC